MLPTIQMKVSVNNITYIDKKGDCNILKCHAFFSLTLIDFETILMNVYSNFDSMKIMIVT